MTKTHKGTMMINSRPINNVDVEASERNPNPRNSIKDYASRREPQSCGGVPIYTGSGPFRSIIDAAIFYSVSLGTPSVPHHNFKVLYFIIIIIQCKYSRGLLYLCIIISSSLWSRIGANRQYIKRVTLINSR